MAHHHHHHGHGHTHSHAHGHTHSHAHGEGRLIWSIGLNLLITVAEVIGGLVSGSLSLLSDAVHNLSDTASLGISYAARRIARREPTARKTFGYKRAEILGAFVNLITLVLIALFLMKEAVDRFLHPQPIDGTVMLAVAVVGLLANVATAVLLFRDANESLNIRSAFLHIVGDGLSSVGVVVGGLLIVYFDFTLIDPILTFAIALYLLFHSYHLLRQSADILMEGTPTDIDLDEIARDIRRIEHVRGIHHLHVWQIGERQRALEAHVVIDKTDLERMEAIKRAVKARLAAAYQITHSTLEFEFDPCSPEREADCYERHTAVPDALRRLESGRHLGKIVIRHA